MHGLVRILHSPAPILAPACKQIVWATLKALFICVYPWIVAMQMMAALRGNCWHSGKK